MCIQCVSEEVLININKHQGDITFCRHCKRFISFSKLKNVKFIIYDRYNKPPYILCGRESKEMLSICLKKIKELSDYKINDAAFIWTEPHSRRISLRLTVQKEVSSKKKKKI